MASAEPQPPVTATIVQRRDGRKAVEEFPDVSLELSRVWLPGRSRARVEARRVTGAFAVEAFSGLAGVILEPPSIPGERVTAKLAREADTGEEASTAGLYRAHVPLTYKPMLVEKVRTRRIREGNDLPNSVFAPDTRYIFQDTAFPWCTTGRVDTSGGGLHGHDDRATPDGDRVALHAVDGDWSGVGQVHPVLLQRLDAVRRRVGDPRHLLVEGQRLRWPQRPRDRV
jgi:hypothetical protein